MEELQFLATLACMKTENCQQTIDRKSRGAAPVAVLDLGGVNWAAASAGVKKCDLAVVLPAAQQVGVLQAEAQARERAWRPEFKLRRVRVAHVPHIAVRWSPLILRLENPSPSVHCTLLLQHSQAHNCLCLIPGTLPVGRSICLLCHVVLFCCFQALHVCWQMQEPGQQEDAHVLNQMLGDTRQG